MDHEGSSVENANLPADRVRENQPASGEAGSLLVRIGYRTLIGSVIVTVIGTIMLAQGRTSFETAASIVRQIGAVSMLISCAIVLLGYRVPQLRRWCATMNEARDRMHDLNRGDASKSSPTAQFSVMGLLILMTALALVCGVLFATPYGVFAFSIAYLHMTTVALFIVVIVYDRGWLRAFCIAAMVPAVLSFFVMSVFNVSLMPGGRNVFGTFGYRIAIAFNWAMVFITGLLGVGVRYYLVAGRRRGGPRGD